MIISDKEAAARLNSPLNLINKMREATGNNSNGKKSAMELFGVKRNSGNNQNGGSNGAETKSQASNGSEEKTEGKAEEEREHLRSFNPFDKEALDITPTVPHASSDLIPHAHTASIPQVIPQPSVEELIKNSEDQIKLGLAHDNALSLLNKSVEALSAKLDDVKADRLPSVIAAANKVVESIRGERREATKNENTEKEVHYHFYTPIQRKIEEFEVIEVG